MRLLRDLLLILLVASGGIAGSQVPRLVQEYEQRLGGARDEAIAAHRRDLQEAAAFGLTYEGFVARYRASDDPVLRAGAGGIAARKMRAEELSAKAAALAEAPYLLRPWVAMQGLDAEIGRAAWAAFEPTLTLDTRFGTVGLLAGWLLHALIAGVWRLLFGRRRRRRRFGEDYAG